MYKCKELSKTLHINASLYTISTRALNTNLYISVEGGLYQLCVIMLCIKNICKKKITNIEWRYCNKSNTNFVFYGNFLIPMISWFKLKLCLNKTRHWTQYKPYSLAIKIVYNFCTDFQLIRYLRDGLLMGHKFGLFTEQSKLGVGVGAMGGWGIGDCL